MEASEPLGLYLHVPFCVSRCSYCDFYSRPFEGRSRVRAFAAALGEQGVELVYLFLFLDAGLDRVGGPVGKDRHHAVSQKFDDKALVLLDHWAD